MGIGASALVDAALFGVGVARLVRLKVVCHWRSLSVCLGSLYNVVKHPARSWHFDRDHHAGADQWSAWHVWPAQI
jgi:hypothetical protein